MKQDDTVADYMRLVNAYGSACYDRDSVASSAAIESAIRKLVEERDALGAQFKSTGHVPYLERMKQLAERAERAEAEAAALRAMLREAGDWLEGIHTGLAADGEGQAAHRVYVLIERIDAALAAKGSK